MGKLTVDSDNDRAGTVDACSWGSCCATICCALLNACWIVLATTLVFSGSWKNWRGGKEDTFELRLRGAASNVHFQPESCKVVVDEVHPALQVLPCPERKGAVVHV